MSAKPKVRVAFFDFTCCEGCQVELTNLSDPVFVSLLPHLDSQKALPISAAIKVDYALHGCPMDRAEFVRVVSHLLHGKEPVIPNYPVCVECKMRETVCRYDLNDHCLGLVARAGCGAPCPADGIPCEACRGFWDHPNEEALEEVLKSRGGLSPERAKDKSRMFTAAMRRDAQ